jgi:hypothetical protein
MALAFSVLLVGVRAEVFGANFMGDAVRDFLYQINKG